MIHVHLTSDMRKARVLFEAFCQMQQGNIEKARMSFSCEVTLKNGAQHCFIPNSIYWKWCLGKTYMLDGELYHSGYRYLERSEDETR